MSAVNVKLAGLELPNPTILASGIMDETGKSLLEMASCGAGAVVTKSIGIEARKGYDNPTIVEMEYGYLNAMGLPNPGIKAFAKEMKMAKDCPVPIIGSIFGSGPKEFSELARHMQSYGASAIELNLSCPHAKGYGMEVGVEPEQVRLIVEEVKSAVNIPVFAKLTPNTHLLLEVAKAVEDAKGDAVVAINTVKAMCINIEARRPVLSNRTGGLSGPAIKPIGVRCVYELYANLQIPVIGVGGAMNWRDVVEYMMAGASAVQIGSAVGRQGKEIFRKVVSGLEIFLRDNGFKAVDEIVGIAHE
ncbi:MAG: dihydroorotate dehydrogenase [Methanomassiliicoccales archaeon]